MDIDTMSLQCFVAVAESKSFTKASQRVSRSQSAVSQQIVKLESLTGKPLFIRGKTIVMTQEGRIFLHYAKKILRLHHEVVEQFKAPDLKGEVRFGISEEFASRFLQDVLTEFTQAHCRISLHIDCDLTINLYDKFKKGDLDLIVIKTQNPQDFKHAVELANDNLAWFGDANLLKEGDSLPLVLSPEPCMYRQSVIKALDHVNIKWHVAFSSHNFASKMLAVKAGVGITVMPHREKSSQVAPITSAFLPELGRSYILLLRKNIKNPTINAFEDFIIKNLR